MDLEKPIRSRARSNAASSPSSSIASAPSRERALSSASNKDTEDDDKLQINLLSPTAVAFTNFSEFKKNDVQAKKQRNIISQLKTLETDLSKDGLVPESSQVKKDSSQPKMRSKDLDLPFKRSASSNKLGGKLNRFLTKAKTKKSPDVLFHMTKLAIIDQNEEMAEFYLMQIPPPFIKKKRVFQACQLFMLAMANRMEKITLLLLDKKFPHDVNSPIFSIKVSPKYTKEVPFRMNTALFPSYFLMAVSLGFETLVKFMIKVGANVNQTWNGLTALHLATFSKEGKPNINILSTLLEYGADPWIGVYHEQLTLIGQLKDVMNCAPDIGSRPTRVSFSSQQPSSFSKDSGAFVPLLSIPQRQIAVYKQLQEKKRDNAAQKMPLDNIQEEEANREANSKTVGSLFKKAAEALNFRSSQHALTPSRDATGENFTEEWKYDKYVLPLAFAASLGCKDAVLVLLHKMYSAKPKRSSLIHPLIFPLVNSNSSNSNLSPLNQPSPSGAIVRSPSALSQYSDPGTSSNFLLPYSSSGNFKQVKDVFSLLIQQDLEITVLLLKANVVDVLQRDPKGATALHLAVRVGNVELIQVLLYFDTNDQRLLNAQGENGWTALHEAISRRNLDVFRLLLKRGANPSIKNDYGDTPSELGSKVGIDSTDLEQVWIGTLPRKSARFDTSSTLMPGQSADILAQFEPRTLQLLQTSMAEDLLAVPVVKKPETKKDKKESRRKTVSGVTPSIDIRPDEEPQVAPKQRQGTMRLPFKIFGRKRHTIDEDVVKKWQHDPDAINLGDVPEVKVTSASPETSPEV